MKNLDNLNLQELIFQEQTNIDEEFLPVAVIAGIWVIQAAICIGLVSVASDHLR